MPCKILVPWPGMEPPSSALQGRLLITGPPRKFPDYYFNQIYSETGVYSETEYWREKRMKSRKREREQNGNDRLKDRNKWWIMMFSQRRWEKQSLQSWEACLPFYITYAIPLCFTIISELPIGVIFSPQGGANLLLVGGIKKSYSFHVMAQIHKQYMNRVLVYPRYYHSLRGDI